MRITLFTGNQARHLALVERLAEIAQPLFVVQECTTVFPGQVPDFFRRSEVMQSYFQRVLAAERLVFGLPRPAPAGVRQFTLRMGDLSHVPTEWLAPALDADAFIVFGASYIRGPLCDELVMRGAVNLHMGVSPFYRGSSTNFWALHDGRPAFVGATIHRLTSGLDSGPILCHVFPPTATYEPFELGMRAVESAHKALAHLLHSGELQHMKGEPQDRSRQLRYSRNSDFTDEVAAEYLERLPTPTAIHAALMQRDLGHFTRPIVH